MAVTLMTTTGSLQDVQTALGIAAGSAPAPETEPGPIVASVETLPSATSAETELRSAEPSPATPEPPPAEATPQDATAPVAPDAEIPDSEFDEDGEPLTERAARSSRTKLQTIKKLRVRARTAELDRARLQGELDAIRAGQTPKPDSAPPATPAPSTETQEPQEANFDTYEAFIEARADYRARKAVREELAQRQQQDEQTRQRQAVAERIQAFEKDHPDYQEVVSNPDLTLTQALAYALQTSPDGPALAYALAKDVPRFKQIVAMTPAETFQAIGELRAELRTASSAKPAETVSSPKPTAAPPPPQPVRGGSVPASLSLDALAKSIQPGDNKTSEWLRLRNAEVARRGR